MIAIRVPDMSCPSCFRRVEEAVRRVKGVEDARVNPDTKELLVEGNPDTKELTAAIRAAGYNPEEQSCIQRR